MPFRRKYAPKRKLNKRKRYSRPMRLRSRVHHFKRTVFLKDAYNITTGTDGRAVEAFRLSDLPNSNEFTNLFDMYRINKIVYKCIPKYTETALTAGGALQNANLQQIHSAIDYDDGTSPAGISTLTEFETYKMSRGNMIHTRVIVPKVELGDGTSASFPKAKQWIDCDNASQVHRGLKVVIPAPASASTTISYDVSITYYISCKDVV